MAVLRTMKRGWERKAGIGKTTQDAAELTGMPGGRQQDQDPRVCRSERAEGTGYEMGA